MHIQTGIVLYVKPIAQGRGVDKAYVQSSRTRAVAGKAVRGIDCSWVKKIDIPKGEKSQAPERPLWMFSVHQA